MNGSEVLNTILNHLNESNKKNIDLAELSRELGYDRPQTLYDIMNGKTKKISANLANRISNKYPQFNITWLLSGEGDSIVDSYNIEPGEKVSIEPMSAYLPSSNFKLLPLYSFDVVGGVNNQEADTAGFIMGYMPFVNAKDDDIAVLVTGNSMYPTFPAGSYVQIRRIHYWKEFLEFGQVHIIELLDDRRLIKEIRKGGDKSHFRLVSHNEKFDDVEISKDFIRSIWLVLSKYEKSTM